jgi:hypothetical protein
MKRRIKLIDILAGFCYRFKTGQSTRFKLISQGFLEDAKVLSDPVKNYTLIVLMSLQITMANTHFSEA